MTDVDQKQLAGMSQEELVGKALSALQNGHNYLAMVCLEQAAQFGTSSIIASHLGYCLALNRQEFTEAIRLGQQALFAEPNSPLFCLNLGRVYLLAGQQNNAIRTFRQGLAFSRDEEIIAELDRIGTRKPPVIKALHRNHPLNKWLGKLLAKMRPIR